MSLYQVQFDFFLFLSFMSLHLCLYSIFGLCLLYILDYQVMSFMSSMSMYLNSKTSYVFYVFYVLILNLRVQDVSRECTET